MFGSGHRQHSLLTRAMLGIFLVSIQQLLHPRRRTGFVELRGFPHEKKTTSTWSHGRGARRGARCAACTTHEVTPLLRASSRTCVRRTCSWKKQRVPSEANYRAKCFMHTSLLLCSFSNMLHDPNYGGRVVAARHTKRAKCVKCGFINGRGTPAISVQPRTPLYPHGGVGQVQGESRDSFKSGR